MPDQPTPNIPSRTSAHLAEAIQKTVEEMQRAERGGVLSRVLSFIGEHWFILAAIVTIPVGWIAFDISPLLALRRIHHEQEMYERAERQADFNARMSKRHMELGVTFLDVDLWREAREEFEEVEKIDPHNVDAHIGIMKTKIMEELDFEAKQDGHKPEVIEGRLIALQKACRQEDAHVYLLMGRAWMNADSSRAAEFLNKAIELRDDMASAYSTLGNLHYLRGDTPKTIEYYEKAHALSPWQQTYLNNLAYQYLITGEYKSAIEKYGRVLSLDDRFLLSYYTYASALRLDGRAKGARYMQEHLLRMLDDGKALGLTRNQGSFVFLAGDGAVWLASPEDKKMYAHYSMAMTLMLLGQKGLAGKHIETARGMEVTDMQRRDVLKLVEYDVKIMRAAQSGFREALDSFVAALSGQ